MVTGEVYTWGDNDEGQLGDGTTNAIQKPRLVAALQGLCLNSVTRLSCVHLAFAYLLAVVQYWHCFHLKDL